MRRFPWILTCALILVTPAAARPADVHAGTASAVFATHITVIYCIRAPCPGPYATLYALNPDGSGGDVELGKIQTASGENPPITSLAVTSDYQVFGSDGKTLYAIGTTSPCCTATPVGPLGVTGLRSLAFTDDGRLFAAGDAGVTQVSPRTGAALASYSAPKGVSLAGGLAVTTRYQRFVASTNPFGPPCGRIPEVCAAVVPPPDGLAAIDLSGGMVASSSEVPLALFGIIGLYYNGAQLMGVWYRQQQDARCGASSALVSIDPATGKSSTVRCLSFVAATAAGRPVPPALREQTSVALSSSHPARGRTQTVTIRSVPGAAVRVALTEPNQATRVANGAVSQSGTFKVAWHVCHTAGAAKVQVKVTSGTASYTHKVSFQIR